MAVPVRKLTVDLAQIVGEALPVAMVRVTLTRADVTADGQVVLPGSIEIPCDVDGHGEADIFPNELGTLQTQYDCEIFSQGARVFPETGHALFFMPDADSALHAVLFSVPPYVFASQADVDFILQQAQDWATKFNTTTSDTAPVVAVPIPLYSAKYNAMLSSDFAQWIDGDVPTMPGQRSARSWAQADLRGTTYLGSARDWAQGFGLIDGTTYKSSRSYAIDAKGSADAVAGSAAVASGAAGAAQGSASAAQASAVVASGSAAAANTSAQNASGAATAASTSATTATTKATAAAGSATAAAGSATGAAGSATSAGTHDAAAGASAVVASDKATVATTAATNAGASATAAKASEVAAAGSATVATTQAGNASTSAGTATTKATAAAGSATAASGSATAASGSAGAAAGSATLAGTHATESSLSANAAAGSAAAALGSAANADLSAQEAADSAAAASDVQAHLYEYAHIAGETFGGQIAASRVQAYAPLSSAWGVSAGTETGGFNVKQGTDVASTWLLSGTTGGVFRAGLQSLNNAATVRLYAGPAYLELNAAGNVSAVSFTGALLGLADAAKTAQVFDNADNALRYPVFTTAGAGGSLQLWNSAKMAFNPSTGALAVTSLVTTGPATVNGQLTVGGDLVVNGTTFTTNSQTVTIDDPVLTLGGDTPPTLADGKDRGIEFRWHDGTLAKDGFFGFNHLTRRFTYIPDAVNAGDAFTGTKGTLDANLVGDVTGNVTGNLTGNVTGNVTGAVNGPVTGNVTGDLTGNVTGNVSGTAGQANTITVASDDVTNVAYRVLFGVTAGSVVTPKNSSKMAFNPSTGALAIAALTIGVGSSGFGATVLDTLNAATAGVNRWFWSPTGHYVPAADATYDVGSVANRVRTLYATVVQIGDGTSSFKTIGTDVLTLYTAGVAKWQWKAAGDQLPLADNTYNIGAAATRVKTTYTVSINIGTGTSGFSAATLDNLVAFTAGVDRWRWTNAGAFMPLTDNAYDIGAGIVRVRNIYAATHTIGAGTSSLSTVATDVVSLATAGAARWQWTAAGVYQPSVDLTYDLGSAAQRIQDAYVGRTLYVGSATGQAFVAFASGFGVYNAYTDNLNNERYAGRWSANDLLLGTEALGTGVARRMVFQTGSVARWNLGADGHLVPAADVTYDLGSATAYARTMYANSLNIKLGGTILLSGATGIINWSNVSYGIKYAGGSILFAGLAPDGMVIFGYAGGILGTTGAGEKWAVQWSNVGGSLGVGSVPILSWATGAVTLSGASLRVNNPTVTNDATNYERLSLVYNSGYFDIATEGGGTGVARYLRLKSGGTGGAIVLNQAGVDKWSMDGNGCWIPLIANSLDIGQLNLPVRTVYANNYKFLASPVLSSDPNTLDDYKEGVWTPGDASPAGLGNFTQLAPCGFVKIGRLVHVNLHIAFPATTNTAQAAIGNLPYPCGPSRAAFSVGYNSSATDVLPLIQPSGTAIVLHTKAPSGIATNSNMNSAQIAISGSYMTA